MSDFIIFQVPEYQNVELAPPMPYNIVALIFEADSSDQAAQQVAERGMFTNGTVHIIDVNNAESFDISVNPDVAPASEENQLKNKDKNKDKPPKV